MTDWGSRKKVAVRVMPFWHDEFVSGDWTRATGERVPRRHHSRPPWWRPFNILLHCWFAHDDGDTMHDHPRWSITICLKGRLFERTPWGERVLTPGAVVLRGHKFIHGFRCLPVDSGRTWTLFIVGRRNRPQNTYVVTRRERRRP